MAEASKDGSAEWEHNAMYGGLIKGDKRSFEMKMRSEPGLGTKFKSKLVYLSFKSWIEDESAWSLIIFQETPKDRVSKITGNEDLGMEFLLWPILANNSLLSLWAFLCSSEITCPEAQDMCCAPCLCAVGVSSRIWVADSIFLPQCSNLFASVLVSVFCLKWLKRLHDAVLVQRLGAQIPLTGAAG